MGEPVAFQAILHSPSTFKTEITLVSVKLMDHDCFHSNSHHDEVTILALDLVI